jgi:hypothetical protein
LTDHGRLISRRHGPETTTVQSIFLLLDFLVSFCYEARLLMTAAQVFVLEIDGRPTLVFDAPDADIAGAMCVDDLLRTDLESMTTNGEPICAPNSRLAYRLASQREIAAFQHAHFRAPESDEPTMVFLINVDGIVMISVAPSA